MKARCMTERMREPAEKHTKKRCCDLHEVHSTDSWRGRFIPYHPTPLWHIGVSLAWHVGSVFFSPPTALLDVSVCAPLDAWHLELKRHVCDRQCV